MLGLRPMEMLLILGVLILISPFLTTELFDDSWVLFGCLLLSFTSYAIGHFLRGSLAGTGRFRQYGLFMGSDGVIRVTACALLVLAGVNAVGAYGLLVGLPPLLAVVIALWPDVPWDFVLYGGAVLMVIMPLFFYPFSRTIWLAIDLAFRPATGREFRDVEDG